MPCTARGELAVRSRKAAVKIIEPVFRIPEHYGNQRKNNTVSQEVFHSGNYAIKTRFERKKNENFR